VDARAAGQRSLLREELSGPALITTRVVAVVYVVLLLIAYVRWIPRWIDFRLSQAIETEALLADRGPYVALTWAAVVAALLAAIVWFAFAALIESRRSHDLFGNFLFVSFVAVGVVAATDVDVILPMQRGDSWPQFQLPLLFAANALTLPWVYVFPDGRVVPRWAILLAAVWAGWSVMRVITPEADQARVGTPAVLLNLGLVASMLASLVFRYFKRSNDVQKQQLKWLLLGGLVFLFAYIATIPIPLLIPELQKPGPTFVYHSVSRMWLSLSFVFVALAIAAAIFRQGLLDIELIVNRTIAYASLTAILVAGFVVISSVANQFLEAITGQRSELVVLATALPLAVLFVPLRTRLLATADRFMSGRRVRTVLFVDIASSTEHALKVGDRAWRELLERFRASVRKQLKQYGGEEIDTAGDGFFVTFEGAGRAIRCARAILDAVRPLGLEARAGVHIGEVEVYGASVSGVAVHVGARLVALAKPNEVIVSAPLRELVGGSNIELRDRGDHELKGLPGMWRVYAVSSA